LGGFAYKPPKRVMRGEAEPMDPAEGPIWQAAGKILNSEPPDYHARGMTQLLLGHRDDAIAALESALARSNDRPAVAIDLSAALIDRGTDADLARALDLSDREWRATRRPEAAWNRALALERMGRESEAARAWDDYLSVDGTSQWAGEARKHRAALQP
jgi:hypothetical protein